MIENYFCPEDCEQNRVVDLVNKADYVNVEEMKSHYKFEDCLIISKAGNIRNISQAYAHVLKMIPVSK